MPGLTADDFEVKQDGVPQTITNFYAVSGGKLLLEDGKSIPLDSAEAAAEVPRELKARYVFYIDNLNIQPHEPQPDVQAVEGIHSRGDRAERRGMVVTFNRSVKVRRAVHLRRQRPARRPRADRARDGRRHDLAGRAPGRHRADQRRPELQRGRSRSRGRTPSRCATISSSPSTASSRRSNSLAGMQGRKIFIYVSEGCRPRRASSSSRRSARSSRTARPRWSSSTST